MARHRLIVGVDYGTTFSGLSYVTTDKKKLEDIIAERSWPGKDGEWKAPTRIAYATENQSGRAPLTENQWGFRAIPPMVMCSWTKLLLDASARHAQSDDNRLWSDIENDRLRLPVHRNAQGVAADYMRGLYGHLRSKLIKNLGPEIFDSTPMDVWLTVPAVWSDQAQNATKEAALEAGFGARPEDTISIIPEPEAAAVAVLKEMTDSLNKPTPGENIMVCDCGGGTVDITSYTIEKLEPLPSFEEICVGIGAKCGATSIDRALHSLMKERFGSAWDRIEERRKGAGSNFMEQWERTKRQFGDPGDDRPNELQLNIRGDSEHDPRWYDEDEGAVILTRDDVRKLFDPTVQMIVSLLTDQKDAIEKQGKRLDRLVLVGGFGDSAYLYSRLKAWCAANGGIKAYCPPHCQAAIVRGAALRGLIGIAPRAKRCRRHYGCEVSKFFRESIDPEGDSYVDKFTARKMCRYRMMWMINKGSVITVDTKATHEVSLTHKVKDLGRTTTIRLYACDEDMASERRSALGTDFVGKVVVDFSGVNLGSYRRVRTGGPFGEKYLEIPFTIEVHFGDESGLLRVRALCNNKVTGSTELVFD